jgi:hypothetical protein
MIVVADHVTSLKAAVEAASEVVTIDATGSESVVLIVVIPRTDDLEIKVYLSDGGYKLILKTGKFAPRI